MSCWQTLDLLASKRRIVPPSIDVLDARDDPAASDALRLRLQQLRQLVERREDTLVALGSDATACALAALRSAGGDQQRRSAHERTPPAPGALLEDCAREGTG